MMKKVMFLLVAMLLSFSVSAATLTLGLNGSNNADQEIDFATGTLVGGSGKTDGGTWYSDFTLTTDEDTQAVVEFSFNPESAVSTALLSITNRVTGIATEWLGAGDLIVSYFFETGVAYGIDFYSVTSTQLKYDVSVSAVPVPAALFLFAPALLGFFGLRRKAAVAA